jgi:hypothetical protein
MGAEAVDSNRGWYGGVRGNFAETWSSSPRLAPTGAECSVPGRFVNHVSGLNTELGRGTLERRSGSRSSLRTRLQIKIKSGAGGLPATTQTVK